MKTDRERVEKAFLKYAKKYDATDIKVSLKIEHTFRVAKLSETIAESIACGAEDIDTAWFMGMLHDIGRFEQLKQFHTFSDPDSVDHADLGVEVLLTENRIQDYLDKEEADSPENRRLIQAVIGAHNKYQIPKELDNHTKMFCNILRDADKIDILRVNDTIPIDEIYGLPKEEFLTSTVTKEVMDSFLQNKSVDKMIKRTAVDHVAGHIALIFDMVYPISKKITKEQGYLNRMLDFQSENEVTQEQFRQMKRQMNEFLQQ